MIETWDAAENAFPADDFLLVSANIEHQLFAGVAESLHVVVEAIVLVLPATCKIEIVVVAFSIPIVIDSDPAAHQLCRTEFLLELVDNLVAGWPKQRVVVQLVVSEDPPINYCRVYPCLLVRQVDQFDRLKLPFIYSVWPLASLPGKSQSLLG